MTARWPQHHLVAAVVLGLVAGPRWAWLVPLIAAAAWATQPRPGWAALAVLAVGVAAVAGQWRVAETWERAEQPLRQGLAVRSHETLTVLEPASQALDGGWRFDARLRGATVEVRTAVAVHGPPVRTGQRWRVDGRLRRLGPGALGARSRGIAVALDGVLREHVGRRGGWPGAVDRLRERMERTLAFGHEPAPGPRTALLRGMVLGQDHAFDAEQEQAYRRSGLAHLVAASGQNVALVAAMVLGLGALVGLRRRCRLVAAIGAVAVYVPLAGSGPSIRRAGVMGVLVLLALALGRPADRWWALLLAALVTILVDPLSPDQLGWQLSFAAVVGLLLLVDPLARGAVRIGWPRWVGMLLAVPIGASAATAPVLAATVGAVSSTGVAANVLVEPLVAPVTGVGMIAGLLGPEARPVSGWAVTATGPLLDWINGVAAWAAAPRWAEVVPGAAWAGLPAALLAVLAVAAARPGWSVRLGDRLRRARLVRAVRARTTGRGRWAIPVVAGLLLVAVVTATAGLRRLTGDGVPASGRLAGDGVAVLAVGQGGATLLRQGAATMLIDAGPPHGRVLDRLEEQGVDRLDVLLLSHAAQDHTGGAPAVARRYRPRLLVDGTDGHRDAAAAVAVATVRAQGGTVVTARRGLRVRSGDLVAELRWPPRRASGPRAGEDPNDRATVVRATVGGLRVLVPSDLEGPVLRRAAGGPVDLLVLPHHGSADQDVPALLRALRPRLAVAQVGAGNRYGHPAPETTAAVRAASVPLRRTDRDGTVVVAGPGGRP